MKKSARIMCLFLAVLMALGTVYSLIAAMVA